MSHEPATADHLDGRAMLGPKLFSFTCFQDWVNGASRRWRFHEVSSEHTVCVDQKGRICRWGAHFMAARDDGSFPIDVHLMRADMAPTRQDQPHVTPTREASSAL